jgi:alpha-glucosidase
MGRRFFMPGFIVFAAAFSIHAETLEVLSPDGRLAIRFEAAPALQWTVDWQGAPVILPSPLGLELEAGGDLTGAWEVDAVDRRTQDTTWAPVYGERARIRDHFNEMAVRLNRKGKTPRRLDLTIRAYDEGAALSYTIPRQKGVDNFVITSENTGFRFAEDFLCHPVYAAQGEYKDPVPLSAVKPECERPLTVEMSGGRCAAVAEARLVDYARMRLRPVKDMPYAVQAHLAGTVRATAPYTTPWRVVMVADSPGRLLEQNYLILNLNDPCAIEDPSWIKPGTIIREVTLRTGGGRACVDFAVEQGIDYIHLDAGWYGHEYDASQDATTVTPDPKRVPEFDLDLHEVIRYAREKGIGVWVYVNRRHLEKQLDEILPLYKSWGISGIKYGFVNVGTQRWTKWLHEAIRKAAEHEIMIDVHDEYRPTGWERTWPNFLTMEGILGNEGMPPPEHNLTLPFTRMLCGPGDYTICWYTTRIKTTHAHQLAASVVYYSPLLFLYWYDRPAQYENEAETAFFRNLPTVWDESRVIHGKIGQYITMARRSGRTWYVVTVNAREKRRLEIPLDFLDAGQRYDAFICSDANPEGGDPFKVGVTEKTLSQGDTIEAVMAANGGHAMRLTPAAP